MIYSDFKPVRQLRPNLFAGALSRRVFPLDCRMPQQLGELLKRLDRQ